MDYVLFATGDKTSKFAQDYPNIFQLFSVVIKNDPFHFQKCFGLEGEGYSDPNYQHIE